MKAKLILLLIPVLVIAFGCSDDTEDPQPTPPVQGPPEISVTINQGGTLENDTANTGDIVLDRQAFLLGITYSADVPNGYQSATVLNQPVGDIADNVSIGSGGTKLTVEITLFLVFGGDQDIVFKVTDKQGKISDYTLTANFPIDLEADQIVNGSWEKSTIEGGNWIQTVKATSDGSLLALVDEKVYKSTDQGTTWNQLTIPGIENPFLVVRHPDGAIYVTDFFTNSLAKSSDNGDSWELLETNLPEWEGGIEQLVIDEDGNFYLSPLFLIANDPGNGLWKSNDGLTWENLTTSLGTITFSHIQPVNSSTVIAYQHDQSTFYRTKDSGANWENIGSPINPETGGLNQIILGSDGNIYMAANEGVYVSSDQGDTWTSMSDGIPAVAEYSRNIFEGSDGNLYCSPRHYGLFIYDKAGNTWKSVGTDIANLSVVGVTEANGQIYVGVLRSSVYKLSM